MSHINKKRENTRLEILKLATKLYISEGEKEEWEYVAKDELVNVKGLFDEKNDIIRFKINSGKYVGEYIIEDITVTEDFKKKSDYLSWMK